MTYNTEIYNELRPYLHAGEDILWAGKPTSLKLSKNAKFPAIFSVFFMAFAVFWMFGASFAGGFFFLFGLPFLFVGAAIFYSTTFGYKQKLKSSIYAVTDNRAIIVIRSRKGTNLKEYIFATLAGVNLEDVRDGVGTIRFAEPIIYQYNTAYGRRRSATYSSDRELTTGFIMIDDVHSVYHLISERISG